MLVFLKLVYVLFLFNMAKIFNSKFSKVKSTSFFWWRVSGGVWLTTTNSIPKQLTNCSIIEAKEAARVFLTYYRVDLYYSRRSFSHFTSLLDDLVHFHLIFGSFMSFTITFLNFPLPRFVIAIVTILIIHILQVTFLRHCVAPFMRHPA